MDKPRFLPTLRELAKTYQAFECLSARHINKLGLTTGQFDIIATLGNTQGMTPKQLTEQTLITKGTLTGVIDRLLAKGLVTRQRSETDARSFIICLTDEGQQLFKKIFPQHLDYLANRLNTLTNQDYDNIDHSLQLLRQALQ